MSNKEKKEQAQWLLDTMQSFFQNESSVELTRTSKGTNWKIKIYNADPQQAFDKSKQLFSQCEQQYGDAE